MVSDEELKQAQKSMLDILLQVHNICEENGITYWLEGGTLLGAIRHKGFIPWDDDIDIAMPRKDFERFCQIASRLLPESLFLQTKDTDKYFKLPIAKVRKHNTFLLENDESGKENYHHGIFIDIIPQDTYKYAWFIRLMQWPEIVRKKRHKYKKGSIKRILVTLYLNCFLIIPITIIRLIKKYFIRHRECFNKNNDEFISHSLEFGYPRETTVKDVFPVKLGKSIFQGHSFYIPNDSHTYLMKYYGEDYMILPPVEKRKGHSKIIKI